MLSRIFDPDNFFFRPLGKLVDVVCLSLLWLVCSAPLVTLGPATAALYDSASRCVRGGQSGPYARFFRTFKENWKTGGAAGLLVAAVVWGLSKLYWVIYARASVGERGVWYAAYYGFWVAVFFLVGFLGYLLPVLSRFEFRLGSLLANCLRLGMLHLPSTLLVGVILTVGGLWCRRYWWPALVTPCLCALACSLPLERIFRPYMEPKEE